MHETQGLGDNVPGEGPGRVPDRLTPAPTLRQLQVQRSSLRWGLFGSVFVWGGWVIVVLDYVFLATKQPCINFPWMMKFKESINRNTKQKKKKEMARVDIDILAIGELKWTRLGEFNSNDHYIYYCGQESLRRNGVAIIVSKRV